MENVAEKARDFQTERDLVSISTDEGVLFFVTRPKSRVIQSTCLFVPVNNGRSSGPPDAGQGIAVGNGLNNDD